MAEGECRVSEALSMLLTACLHHCLNHTPPVPPTPTVLGKIVFHETCAWRQNAWGLQPYCAPSCLYLQLVYLFLWNGGPRPFLRKSLQCVYPLGPSPSPWRWAQQT